MKNVLSSERGGDKGFTLIELLVVIVIIGILSAFVTANLLSVKQRARDAQRKSDLRQIQTALELYRNDVGSYPAAASLTACGSGKSLTSGSTTYIQIIPCDPLGTGVYNAGVYYYYLGAGSTSYTVIACLENANDGDGQALPSGIGAPAATTCSSKTFYVVQNV